VELYLHTPIRLDGAQLKHREGFAFTGAAGIAQWYSAWLRAGRSGF
jgi:hypothetical protein